jgi:hypothetical protein
MPAPKRERGRLTRLAMVGLHWPMTRPIRCRSHRLERLSCAPAKWALAQPRMHARLCLPKHDSTCQRALLARGPRPAPHRYQAAPPLPTTPRQQRLALAARSVRPRQTVLPRLAQPPLQKHQRFLPRTQHRRSRRGAWLPSWDFRRSTVWAWAWLVCRLVVRSLLQALSVVL